MSSNLTLAAFNLSDVATILLVNAGWTVLVGVAIFGLVTTIKVQDIRTQQTYTSFKAFMMDKTNWLHSGLFSLIGMFGTWTVLTCVSGLWGLVSPWVFCLILASGFFVAALGVFAFIMTAGATMRDER